jgi:hypothetical protein
MKKKSCILIILLGIKLAIFAQTRYALLVGINEYEPTVSTPKNFITNRNPLGNEWSNLEGCLNDIQAIRQLINIRFGFAESNIKILSNQEATHESIKNELSKLTQKAQRGDIVFFYYSGHGSQVKNSLSYDGTGSDQTIVPSDLYDIRNKELAIIFNEIMDKIGDSGKLTVIFDSCHSGGIARGKTSHSEPKSRDIPAIDIDFKDAREYPKIEDRGALVISAAQRNQPAKEANDEVGNAVGAFSYALVKALQTAPLNESAERIFMRTNIFLKTTNRYQDPILGGNATRIKQGLFGDGASLFKGKITVAVQQKTNQQLTLQGGIELGLSEGTILRKIQTKDSVQIRIVEAGSIGKSTAEVIKGNVATIMLGDFFEVTQFAVPDKPNLSVSIPASNFSLEDLLRQTKDFVQLSKSGYLQSVTDPIKEIPAMVIQYFQNQWQISNSKNAQWQILQNLSSETLKRNIPKDTKVLLQLPAYRSLSEKLKLGENSENNAIKIVSEPSQANYTLMGILKDTLHYGWVKTELIGSNAQGITPSRSNFFTTFCSLADSLTEYALRLGRINAWINLPSPASENATFPYLLGIKNRDKNQVYTATQKVFDQERMSLVLKTDSVSLINWNQKKRFCYVFVIDVQGKTTLLYPYRNLGSELFPLRNSPFPLEEPLKVNFKISKPFGYDTYFLLTTETPILDLSIFDAGGVLTRDVKKNDSPLSKVLRNVGSRTRGVTMDTPMNWSIQKLMLLSSSGSQ